MAKRGRPKKGSVVVKKKRVPYRMKRDPNDPMHGLFKVEYNLQAYKLCLLGMTNKMLADFYNINIKVIEAWMKKKPEFRNAVHAGRDEADADITYAIFRKIKGYVYTETKITKNRQGAVVKKEITTKEMPADAQAGMRWLALRQKLLWADNKMDVKMDLNIKYVQDQLKNKEKYTLDDLKSGLKKSFSQLKKEGLNALPN